jgi:hypothetical protein
MSRGARRFPIHLPVIAALLLAACSTTKIVYDNLDWVVSWQIGKFVSLKEPQKELLDSGFKAFWQWHRSTQLSLYVHDLRELADTIAQPLTRQQVTDFLERTGGHGKRAFHEALPELVKLFQAMDDDQVGGLLKRMGERREQQVRDDASLSVEELQDRAAEDTEKNLNEWIGSLTTVQQQRVHDWAQARRYENALWHNYQANWASAFGALLSHRHEDAFADRLKQLFDEPDVPMAR